MTGIWALRRLWRSPRQALAIGKRGPIRSLHNVRGSRHSIQHSPRHHLSCQGLLGARALFTEAIPSILVPPAIFVGLLLALWTWKCIWIVVLQDKLLYLSWLPPLSRSESIADYAGEFRGVQWTENSIRSLDGTKLALCEGRFPTRTARSSNARKKSVVICYFQGNGGSTPLRLPLLSQVMRTIQDSAHSPDVEYIVVALSYRGYWKSLGRATQRGIELDAQAFLKWVSETYNTPDTDLVVVLWGHSLGAAVASTATVTQLSTATASHEPAGQENPVPISGLILEAPISSIKDMLVSLYPQKWLPYRYLWPFSWNNWDVAAALEKIAHHREEALENARPVPPIFILSAANDEVIPLWVADQLEEKAKTLGLDVERKDVKGAMHIEGPLKVDGRKALVNFIFKVSSCK
ncbi:Alpha/Beta hydrolase protein [Aspergillus pseudodeflectus]|uniref:Alpha/Beta hydrolase protein n=1 Tax=Aspergillus pseudodeflectus TaxID=176178 RepID=A0ABR4JNB9_9EURO